MTRVHTPCRPVRVAVIGAGLGGVATAVRLRRAGIESFTVFERSAGPGGVWWQNTYPGCEVDVPSHAYSFSFMPYDWSRTHAGHAELQRYVEDVIDHFGIRDRFRFRAEVLDCRWDEDRGGYGVRTAEGVEHFDAVVSCVGMLSHPRVPTWPGLGSFTGPLFHTAHYEHQHDLSDKTVAVVGTGSTACQLVPALAPRVRHLDLYQREPGWVMPKKTREFSPAERGAFSTRPARQKLERIRLFRGARKVAGALRIDSDHQRRRRRFCEEYIRRTVHDPAVQRAVTPDYPYGCKRPVFASGFYPALNAPNVRLVPHAVREVTRSGLVDDTGTERPADVLILATGFHATRYLATVAVTGPGGLDLQRAWAAEPTAFLGVTVPGFPNFFIVYGPNTNGGWSVITQLERQAELIARTVRRLRAGRVVDTRPSVAAHYDRWVQRRIATELSTAAAGCTNYYHAPTGKNVTQWPLSHTAYLAVTRVLPWFGFSWGPAERSVRSAGPERQAEAGYITGTVLPVDGGLSM